jgi:type IX secretion system PorP/SprF family membrane protein
MTTMNKIASLLVLVALSSGSVFSQQFSLNSQYLFNEAAINPAAAGSKDYIPIHLNFRKQWAGFDGSPTTQTLTSHADLGKNLGFGGTLFNDVTGPSRTTGLNLMLSYRLRLTKDNLHAIRLGMGLTFSQHLIDVNKLTTVVAEDPAINRAFNNQFVPDGDMGAYYTYSNKGFFGVSLKNAFQVRRDLFNYNQVFVNALVRHYYIMGGYNFELGEKWTLKTAALMRLIEARPFQFDLTTIAQYKNLFWFGAGYRHLDAVTAMAGVQVGVFRIGYAYDFTLSDIRRYSNGSHEIFLELQLFRKQKSSEDSTPWYRRNKIYSPAI